MRPDGAYDRVKLHMAGEALLIVEFGAALTIKINDAVLAFDRYLQEHPLKGVRETAPTGRSVVVRFDPLVIAPESLRARMSQLVETTDWLSISRTITPKRWRMPVCYGGCQGPDLAALAEQLERPVEDLIIAHCAQIQRVFMIGFAPGFLYTGNLPAFFDVPRLATIKPVVPAGSISVAIGQSVISSTDNPTGWHTIGRTPFVNFAPLRQPSVVIQAGDEIEFVQIDQVEYEDLHASTDGGLRIIETGRGNHDGVS